MKVVALILTLLLFQELGTTQLDAQVYGYPRTHNAIITLGSEPTKEVLNPYSIKVLVWNMFKGKKPSWESDFKSLTESIDIALLQETYLDYQMTRVFRDHPSIQFKTATSFILVSRGSVHTGTTIGSNTKMKDIDYKISEDREPIIKTPKVVTYAKFDIKVSKKQLLVVTIHALNFVNSKKLIGQLRDIAKIVRAHDGPVIWGGDFNTWSKKKLRNTRELMHELGMKEVPFGVGRMEVFGNVLDYVFYKGLKLRDSYVLAQTQGSDHKPMIAVFTIDEEE